MSEFGIPSRFLPLQELSKEKDSIVPLPNIPLWKVLLSEFIGTFTLVFIGISAAAQTAVQGGSFLGTALAFGFVLITLIYILGSYSGANFNPAVSFGLALTGRMNWGIMLAYWITQFIAGIAAAALVAYFFGTESGVGATIGSLTHTNPWGAVLAEAIATFFFVITVLIVTRRPALTLVAAIVIGIALGVGILSIEPLTGGCVNPARGLGSAIFSRNMGTYWIYLVGPLLGALFAGLIYKIFIQDFSCCDLVDECGNKILDECGNSIKQCRVPSVDNCGNQVYDDCCQPVYETYIKCYE